MDPSGPILFYDGVCGLCNRVVRFVLRHDGAGRIRFAALQSPFAVAALARHGCDAGALDTMSLLLEPGTPRERVLSKSDGIVALLRELGGVWALLAVVGILPRALRDRAYGFVVRNRYRWFGRYDVCPIPPAALRERFADLSDDAPPARAEVG